ncbi:MAG TPA: DUF4253 domain-containing protein [Planctomycetota bacterium]|nr:DUF4253 domain-containing protein [Planctomycetota bacterium]
MDRAAIALVALALASCGHSSEDSATPAAGQVAAEPTAAEGLRSLFSSAGEKLPPLRQISANRPDLLGFQLRSEDALSTWERLRALTERTGYYPVLLRDEHGMLAEERGLAPAEQLLEAAKALDGKAWLEARAKEANEDPEAAAPRGKPDEPAEAQNKFVLPFDVLSGKPVDDLWLLLIPTRFGHEVPAYIGFGGWNACPPPEVHVAVLRHWHERYGAELVTMGGDVIELRAGRPTASATDSLVLAFEQFHYCEDIVTQGVGTLDALADTLRKSTVWYFWWD